MSKIVVIGAGHNGLICGTYLAKAGHDVTILEARSVVGGCAVTEEIYPGFKFSRASYVQSLLRPQIIEDFGLVDCWGLKFIPRSPVSSYTPLPEGGSLVLGHDMQANIDSISAFSPRDAQNYPKFEAHLSKIASAIEPLLDHSPTPNLRNLGAYLKAGLKLGLGAPEAVRTMLAPAQNLLDEWFDSEPLKGTLGTDAVIGAYASPASPGTGYVLFHHVMGGIWSYIEGGMGALSQALASEAEAFGVKIRKNTRAQMIGQIGKKFEIVVDGGAFFADAVVSSLDPKATLDLFSGDAFPAEYSRAMDTIDYSSPVVKFNFALDKLPKFKGKKVPLTGTIHIGALTLAELDQAYREAVGGKASSKPMVELTIPSVLDKTLAPKGKHVASAFVQYAPVLDKRDPKWPSVKRALAKNVLREIDGVAPGFSESILHMEVLAAPELEDIFGLTGGNIFHGAMTPDRLALFRPILGWSEYTTPVPNLFMCGAGTHPGGGVMGASGRNAARTILRRVK